MVVSMKERMPTREEALPDRANPLQVTPQHYVNGSSIKAPFPPGHARALFGLGCFWGAERLFWRLPGVVTTAVGYAGGYTANPSYEDVCSGLTGHTEVVQVVWDPAQVSFDALLKTFWEAHDPTQGLRQGNDRGSQYRSALYATTREQLAQAQSSASQYAAALASRGLGPVTTEIAMAGTFYYAETAHQQYLAKNPGGYCGLRGTGVPCPDANTESQS
jgi:peptide-methionine (S)-S-oxide reductase